MIPFVKGHGTENDFVVLPDPEARLDLTAERVAALCDRRRGLGADGVLRVVRSAALGVDGPEWFMDYRNADGSIAEMCGNGVRVFARYLQGRGWAGGEVGTRAGVKSVTFSGDRVSVEMGPAVVFGESVARVGGVEFAGIAVDVGNPHLACVTSADIGALDLTSAPWRDVELFPSGANVEFIAPAALEPVAMRVHERGVGETRSCGTGTVAAALASLRAAGRSAGRLAVDTPGGRLEVTVRDGGASTALHGPAVLVAHGELTADWWESTGQPARSVGHSTAR
ncbi:diaminopimelate epimerase [Pseudonocardia oroxyli]|uniref:Diaminopimelate epimerase n=1 Tax=Pseudonocardia oroxyli TaxID=366584 RepID=A0A1G7JX19_PSEOR|nr:diaminopimelate epimerase [Pseudonocardia oroxyli]SDF29497.1 diaminopimelate epimerase [Pseudonocardia oroxyli]